MNKQNYTTEMVLHYMTMFKDFQAKLGYVNWELKQRSSDY